ncbi:polysaccharide deacetylase family protein [Altererythrobacter sp. ZODW24]|uniref:polysaccharide deacetylase family protein n=1 Tax=Altererythrobacter sp. ZODW24 TaxID=2185142 RepID=UPI001F072AF6|nr:polysaccharide deacetylase family protein [Altererythrobacter sp. ZODW24]
MRGAFLALAVLLLAACVSAAAPVAESGKRIALTFDDIPRHPGAFFSEDERTERMITHLRETGVEQAAFFLNPGKIAERPGAEARIARYVAAGHVIANHTSTHPQLSDTDVAAYLANIDDAETWLKGREGYRAWFRFPFLDEGRSDKAKRDAIRAGLAERGLQNGYVTVDASDWFYEQAVTNAVRTGQEIDMDALRDLYVESHVQSAEFNDQLARKTLGRSPAHVMLLHETDLAALYLGDLIRALKAKGWTIISADEAFADPIAKLQPDVPSAQGTLIEALAWERGLPAPRWYARNNTALAQKEFDTRVLGKE